MADQDAQQRTLPASQRKLQKAREEGQVARSRDLSHFIVVGAGVALLALAAPALVQLLRDALAGALRFDSAALLQPHDTTLARLRGGALLVLGIALPIGAVVAALSVGGAVAAGGWTWSTKALMPKFERLDPLAGIGRMVSKQQLTDTLKACTLALLLGALGALYLRAQIDVFGGALALPLPAALGVAGDALLGGLALLLLVLGAFALVDVPLQRWMHAERLKMSHREAKEEHKEVEGNQEVKAKARARMRELANRRMLAAVPRADLVVMNPTHYAVALKYDDATMTAPRVVAKGADLMALRIRDAANDARVPVLQAPPLARALYTHAELDREIPAQLFSAVAQVLAWVYQLRAAMAARAALPPEPSVDVPDGFDPHAAA
jgi:flagellar biosynthetic protein FlhB